jgi:hypothetical protein
MPSEETDLSSSERSVFSFLFFNNFCRYYSDYSQTGVLAGPDDKLLDDLLLVATSGKIMRKATKLLLAGSTLHNLYEIYIIFEPYHFVHLGCKFK